MNILKISILVLASIAAISSNAEFIYSAETKTLTANIPQNTTIALDSDNAAYLTSNLVTNFVKTGDGVLSAELNLSAYLGDITIEQGVYSFVTNTSLGKLAGTNVCGAVRVKNGATLDCHNRFANAWTWWNKCIMFEGEGAAGWGGALTYSGDYEIARMVFSSNLVMTANATINNRVTRSMYMSGGSTAMVLDMNGYDLTFKGSNQISWGCLNILNPGNFIVDSGTLTIQNSNTYFGGDSSNALTFNSGTMRMNKVSGGDINWTLNAQNLAGISIADGHDPYVYNNITNSSYWSGPVHLGSKFLNVSPSKWHIAFHGPIDGDGGLNVVGNAITNGVVHLVNPSNSFAGGVNATQADVRLWNDGALPANGGPLVLTNASVRLMNDEATYELPALTLSKTGTVYYGSGNWRGSVTKTGAGDFVWNSCTTSQVIDVKQGRLVIKDTSRYNMAGLVESSRIYVNGYAGITPLWNRFAISTNCVTMSPAAYYDKDHHLWLDDLEYYNEGGTKIYDRYMLAYSGYIWNNESTNVTWSFAGASSTHMGVSLDGTLVFKFVGDAEASTTTMGTVTDVTPGPHKIDIRGYTFARSSGIRNGNLIGNKTTGETLVWPSTNFAVGFDCWGRSSRNQADYVKLIDKGDGMLLTWGLPSDFATCECIVPGTSVVRTLYPEFGCMKFAAGTGVKIERNNFKVGNLEGVPSIEGAQNEFKIAESWKVSTSSIKNEEKLIVAGKLVFEDDCQIIPVRDTTLVSDEYTIATAANGIVGTPTIPDELSDKWSVRAVGNDLKLYYHAGLILLLK